ncbi:hypothetical protein SB724_20930, partial [Bacillus sp. SIMBA_031]|uniref:hypothetical protein n=1 Tax=Bacillus sp. SIMBA_031 TaxID=3085774 RepID=UPI00397B9F27
VFDGVGAAIVEGILHIAKRMKVWLVAERVKRSASRNAVGAWLPSWPRVSLRQGDGHRKWQSCFGPMVKDWPGKLR